MWTNIVIFVWLGYLSAEASSLRIGLFNGNVQPGSILGRRGRKTFAPVWINIAPVHKHTVFPSTRLDNRFSESRVIHRFLRNPEKFPLYTLLLKKMLHKGESYREDELYGRSNHLVNKLANIKMFPHRHHPGNQNHVTDLLNGQMILRRLEKYPLYKHLLRKILQKTIQYRDMSMFGHSSDLINSYSSNPNFNNNGNIFNQRTLLPEYYPFRQLPHTMLKRHNPLLNMLQSKLYHLHGAVHTLKNSYDDSRMSSNNYLYANRRPALVWEHKGVARQQDLYASPFIKDYWAYNNLSRTNSPLLKRLLQTSKISNMNMYEGIHPRYMKQKLSSTILKDSNRHNTMSNVRSFQRSLKHGY